MISFISGSLSKEEPCFIFMLKHYIKKIISDSLRKFWASFFSEI